MKKKITGLALALMLAFSLCVPSFAADISGAEACYVITSGPLTFHEWADLAETHYVTDASGLLTFDEWADLEELAANISVEYGCGVYVVTVGDYRRYGDGDIYDVATQIYRNPGNGFGVGDGRDGIILLLSMKERDYALFVYGEKAEYAFNDYGLEQLEDAFLDYLGDNDWNGGFNSYLRECDRYLAGAQQGKPVRANPILPIVVAVLISCVIALAVCLILRGQMKTVRQKNEAREYVAAGGLHLTQQVDQYTHTTRTSRKIETNSGSSSSHSGGGGHGRSGKF